MIMTTPYTENSGCNVLLHVDEVYNGVYYVEDVRLWIIAGGTPALDFGDYGFTVRYPTVEQFSSDKWIGRQPSTYDKNTGTWTEHPGHYESQAPDTILGTDVLPECDLTVLKFLEKHVPLRNLRKVRMDACPRYLRSKGFRDKQEHTKAHFKWECRALVSPVTVESKVYSGRCDDVIARLAPPVWFELAKTLVPFYNTKTWEDLSEYDFKRIQSVLKKVEVTCPSTQ